MSTLWQTGEPPHSVELLIEYEWDTRHCRAVATLNGDCFVDASTGEDMSRIKLLRWSTLDAAPDVVGRLEALLASRPDDSVNMTKTDGGYWASISDDSGLIDVDGNDEAEAPTLAAAIEKLCGGTDGP